MASSWPKRAGKGGANTALREADSPNERDCYDLHDSGHCTNVLAVHRPRPFVLHWIVKKQPLLLWHDRCCRFGWVLPPEQRAERGTAAPSHAGRLRTCGPTALSLGVTVAARAAPRHRGGENSGAAAVPWPSVPAASTPPRAAASATRRTAAPGRGHRFAHVAAGPPRRRDPSAGAKCWPSLPAALIALRSAARATRRNAAPGREHRRRTGRRCLGASAPTEHRGGGSAALLPRRGHRCQQRRSWGWCRSSNAPNSTLGTRSLRVAAAACAGAVGPARRGERLHLPRAARASLRVAAAAGPAGRSLHKYGNCPRIMGEKNTVKSGKSVNRPSILSGGKSP